MTRRLSPADYLTLANGVLGFLAITYVIDKKLLVASVLILVAAVVDGLDGWAARRWGTTHSRGAALDSVADAISFCLAPALLLYTEFYDPVRGTAWTDLPNALAVAAATLVAIFGLFRLARFVEADHRRGEFVGFPTPANALFLVSLVHLFGDGPVRGLLFSAPPLVLGASLLTSFLMVSEIPYPKVGDAARVWVFVGAAVFGGLLLLAAVLQPGADLPPLILFTFTLALSVAYLAGGPLYARARPREEVVPVHGR